mgnify:CR=1 FL=1|jgi:cytochrome c oxidase cbb3-type subunit I
MDDFNEFIRFHFKASFAFFAIGLAFGLVYSINLLGYSLNSPMLDPYNMRTIHISLTLYGFITLMLSTLPFLLINKEVGASEDGLRYLNIFFVFWYIFLVFMIVTLLFGNHRGLAFYDFNYSLNFILAAAGLFYAVALYKFIKLYETIPMWVKVSFGVVLVSPIALLILMNPIIGQVEKTVSGPHGDNTLGMSLALIPLYYLIIKLLNKEEFAARWNVLWIVPTVLYFASVLYRTFVDSLSYEQEWFLQYLTLLYVPILYRWYKDSDIEGFSRKALLTSILAFLFVDVEGNILFIPDIRWLFHRNDLIVAHSHVALAIGVFFMVVAMFSKHIEYIGKKAFYNIYLFGILGIFTVLSLSGFAQAGFLALDVSTLWIFRSVFGFIVLLSLLPLVNFKRTCSRLDAYNLLGVANDGLGGIFLILLAAYVYPLLGFSFEGKYEYVVFAFVSMTGVTHLMALSYKEHSDMLARVTAIVRVFLSSVFFALYLSGALGVEALIISTFDLLFASVYFVFLYKGGAK